MEREFLSASDGNEVLPYENEDYCFVGIGEEGDYVEDGGWNRKHIDQVVGMRLVDRRIAEAQHSG